MKPEPCKDHHNFQFLRQEKRNIGYDRSPVWQIEDLFFCASCLEYRRIIVEKRTPRSDSFTEEYVQRLV